MPERAWPLDESMRTRYPQTENFFAISLCVLDRVNPWNYRVGHGREAYRDKRVDDDYRLPMSLLVFHAESSEGQYSIRLLPLRAACLRGFLEGGEHESESDSKPFWFMRSSASRLWLVGFLFLASRDLPTMEQMERSERPALALLVPVRADCRAT